MRPGDDGFELCSEPLDTSALEQRLHDPAFGARVCFTGTTRGHNRGKSVLRLEYEAFERMSGPQMQLIFARCRERLGGAELRMLVAHRVGVVGVGEPSVWIGVASPHRAQAFEACRFLIDELKASLPIWKREIYSDGAHWVGDRS
jgi:molybdopterin synthase catalytic subunit